MENRLGRPQRIFEELRVAKNILLPFTRRGSERHAPVNVVPPVSQPVILVEPVAVEAQSDDIPTPPSIKESLGLLVFATSLGDDVDSPPTLAAAIEHILASVEPKPLDPETDIDYSQVADDPSLQSLEPFPWEEQLRARLSAS